MKKPARATQSAKTKKSAPKKAAKKKIKAAAFYAKSKRLGFRFLDATDEALYCGLFTDAAVMQFVGPPLSQQQAEISFKKALQLSHATPTRRRISVIVDRATNKALGISSIKMIDAEGRHAEGGLLFKTVAQMQRFAIESSLALIGESFKRHSIDELCAEVALTHKAGERLVVGSGYSRGPDLPPGNGRLARSTWSITREAWVESSDRA